MDSKPGSHSVYSPSGAHSWVKCPSSIQARKHLLYTGVIKIPESSAYAAEGTLAHEYAESWLRENSPHFPKGYDRENIDAIYEYVEYVRWLRDEEDGILFVENHVKIPSVHEDCFGTVDAVIITDEKVHVIDLKFGRGIAVDAVENLQMMMYASGVLDDTLLFPTRPADDFEVVLHINMPRIRFYPPEYSKVWTTTAGEIRAKMREVHDAALVVNKQVDVGGLPASGYNPSEKTCQWCNVKPVCKPYQDSLLADFDDLTDPRNVVTDAELEDLFIRKPEIVKLLESLERYIEAQFQGEETCDRFQRLMLKPGRSVSKWKDEDAVVSVLTAAGQAAYDMKIKGITEVRKMFKGKETVDALIEKVPGKMKLVVKDAN